MVPANHQAYITTEGERCRICYTCVRECPAKAIRIVDGQADVVPERCITCGNCIKVCSVGAKQARDSTARVTAMLDEGRPTAAVLAPSFPAEWPDCAPEAVAGMVRALGFDQVCEVAFGADLVAERYRQLLDDESRAGTVKRHIATTCPAVITFIERHHPDLTDCLTPIVSPMIAMGRALKQLHGPALRVVFIGPCIAKKAEADSPRADCGAGVTEAAIDATITFGELRELLLRRGIEPDTAPSADFDPPHPAAGALFPVSRGMLQAAGIREDLIEGQIVATEGRRNTVEAIKEFAEGNLDARLLEVLCCEGCIMGAGMTTDAPLFSRRSQVSSYVRERMRRHDPVSWREQMDRFANLDLARAFLADDQRLPAPQGEQIEAILGRMGKVSREEELNCGACGYETCREHAMAIYKGLAESEMCLPYMVTRLSETVQELEQSHAELATTQEQLMQSEKLASMGQLAAGIAHEVNNPLGVVLMYAHLLLDDSGDEAKAIHDDLRMIASQADRCKKIVAGLLDFARQNKVLRQPANIIDTLETAIKNVPRPPAVALERSIAVDDPVAEIDADQLIQALTNLIANAYSAMESGGTLSVVASDHPDTVSLTIADTGTGIPPDILGRIFDPFFTTKQIGIGTGLGLAIVYGIVKMHRGDIAVKSNTDAGAGPTGTTFTITLPRKDTQTNG
ncbi:MAG: [Fe-Fe] hydrogenase large subunit C-terminal domain-containing protein [Planctomycetota bacterium]